MALITKSISVVVSTFNRADLISDTLASIMRQTLKPAEVLIIDDGSTDNTQEVVRKFPVRYHRQPNSGQCVAVNNGVSMAASDWIALTDSDDLWCPTHLESSVEALNKSGGEYCFSNFVHVRNGRWESQDKFSTGDVDWFLSDLTKPLYPKMLQWQPIFPSTLVMSKAFFNKVGGFDPNFTRSLSKDFEFSLRCNQHPNATVVREPQVGIRKHAGNISGSTLKALQGEVIILRHAAANHPMAAQYLDIIDAQIALRTEQAAGLAYDQKEWETLIRLYDELRHPHWKLRIKRLIAAVFAA